MDALTCVSAQVHGCGIPVSWLCVPPSYVCVAAAASEKKADPEPPKEGPTSQSLSDVTSQKPTMTAEEAAAALAAQKAAAEPPVITPETLAQDWWRQLTYVGHFTCIMYST